MVDLELQSDAVGVPWRTIKPNLLKYVQFLRCFAGRAERGAGGLTERTLAAGWSFLRPAAAARGCGQRAVEPQPIIRSTLQHSLAAGAHFLTIPHNSVSHFSPETGALLDHHA